MPGRGTPGRSRTVGRHSLSKCTGRTLPTTSTMHQVADQTVARGLMTSPELYPFQVNWPLRQVWMLEATERFYRDAAFLDQRALTSSSRGRWMSLAELELSTTRGADPALGLIFHVGHCGSTLLSRALGLCTGFFSLREPLPLRDLAALHIEADEIWAPMSGGELLRHQATLRALWARTPRPGQRAVVKATSFCSALAADWLERYPADRAVLLAMAPEKFIATVVASEGYVADLAGGARLRMSALAAATGARLAPLHTMATGEVAAMTVLAELVNLDRAAERAPQRCLRVDFDAYLARPVETLPEVARHFGVGLEPRETAMILQDPLLGRYSKATDYAFSAAEREQRLRESRERHAVEIERGVHWLQRFSAGSTVARDALRHFGYSA
jgi:hypothetical protein